MIPYEYSRVLNPTFVPAKGSVLTQRQTEHINVILDQVQSPLAYINIVRDRANAVKEEDFPYYMGCKLLESKRSKEGIFMKLQRRDVVFAIYRNRKDEDYTFSKTEPEIVDECLPDPVQPDGF